MFDTEAADRAARAREKEREEFIKLIEKERKKRNKLRLVWARWKPPEEYNPIFIQMTGYGRNGTRYERSRVPVVTEIIWGHAARQPLRMEGPARLGEPLVRRIADENPTGVFGGARIRTRDFRDLHPDRDPSGVDPRQIRWHYE